MYSYVDTEQFEMEILTAERRRVRETQRRLAENKRIEKRERRFNLLERLIGLAITGTSCLLAFSGIFYDRFTHENDCTFLFLLALIGLCITFDGFGNFVKRIFRRRRNYR